MKKPRNTPQFDDAVEASSSRDATDPVDAATASEIVAEIPIIAAPNVAEASAPAAAQSPRPQLPPEPAKIEPAPPARKEPPILPRVAILGPPPRPAPRIDAPAPAPTAGAPAAAMGAPRPRRFALLHRLHECDLLQRRTALPAEFLWPTKADPSGLAYVTREVDVELARAGRRLTGVALELERERALKHGGARAGTGELPA